MNMSIKGSKMKFWLRSDLERLKTHGTTNPPETGAIVTRSNHTRMMARYPSKHGSYRLYAYGFSGRITRSSA